MTASKKKFSLPQGKLLRFNLQGKSILESEARIAEDKLLKANGIVWPESFRHLGLQALRNMEAAGVVRA